MQEFRYGVPPARRAAAGGRSSSSSRTAPLATPTRTAKKRKLLSTAAARCSGSADAAEPAEQAAVPGQGGLPEKLGDGRPLRLIIVGHNPSDTAWREGHYYANPSNHFWRILKDVGIAPTNVAGPADDDCMPGDAGVGLTDVGSGFPGTDSSKFTSRDFAAWRSNFFRRLAAHVAAASAAAGCTCGRCGAPPLLAFSGKRQFAELFPQAGLSAARGSKQAAGSTAGRAGGEGSGGGQSGGGEASGVSSGGGSQAGHVRLQARRPASIATGRQWVLPQGWPLPLDATEVWVMTSTSGAAALTREQRYQPWRQLAQRLAAEPWPRPCQPRCRPVGLPAAP